MTRLRALLFTSILLASCVPVEQSQTPSGARPAASPSAAPLQDLTRYVDPFVGTGGHGHTYPGATLPFGMAQLSPDTRLTGWDGCSGYHHSDSVVYGFSHTHLSGTGVSDYGDILLMPTAGEPRLEALGPEGDTKGGYASRFSHANEQARPGYYSVRLEDENILAELTATPRAGLHRYTFPGGARPGVTLDLRHRDKVLDSRLLVTSDRRVEGYRRSEGWARDQIVYFAVEFSRAFNEHAVAEGAGAPARTNAARGTSLRASFRFDALTPGGPLLARVGISAVSAEGARRNLEAEIYDWDFERVRADADRAWNEELNKIVVAGGTEGQRRNFYTALYHAMLAPNLFTDADGQYLGRDLKPHRAEGFTNYTVFSLWDTFRAAHPLYTIIDRRRTRDFVNTFIAQHEQAGRLPVWELWANETDTMIGYHAASVIADAAAKDVGGFDLEKAFAAMRHSATLKHFGLGAYAERGYISSEDEPESVSKTLEYAYDDWCVAQVARLLKREDDYRHFARRAQSYKNLFDPATGFMRARRNGRWAEPFDPREVNFNFTEANAWQYAFFAPHDIAGLMELMGGEEAFARKLDAMFAADPRTTGREQADITGLMGQYAHGNEPSHHVAYLYNFAGQPWKTQARVRRIMDEFYRPTPDGLIGNEDCGQMSAWYVLSAAGFYPVTPGSPVYATGSPLFDEIRFNLENGEAFTVRALNQSPQNVYVQSATLDGRPYTKSFITHSDIMRGGELVFTMSERPNTRWGTGAGDSPVAAIQDELIVPAPAFTTAADTFRESLPVTLRAAARDLKIFYTTDGSEPTENSKPYRAPFRIVEPTTVKAVAYGAGGARSPTVAAVFRRVPNDWRVRLLSSYSPQYTGGGDLALADGVRGGKDFRTGAWQGYQGQDFEAVVDLGRPGPVARVGAGFLQDSRSWIWMPREVVFELSEDGQNFEQVAQITNDVSDRAEEVLTKDFALAITPRRARYVRVRAKTYGRIPDWHAGAGGSAWIFIDEIIVE
ncbi:MAG TPA: GH92 family glycosyl hydrolase [Pyrinomonadaceae bacterium]